MKLITKEIVRQALLVDPSKNDGLVLSASLMLREGIAYSFRDIERVKDGVAFVNKITGALMMVDELELVGLAVEPNVLLEAKHNLRTLPALIAWLEKNERKAA